MWQLKITFISKNLSKKKIKCAYLCDRLSLVDLFLLEILKTSLNAE